MKSSTLFIALFLILFSPVVKGNGIDSLKIDNTFIDVGEVWYTDYFTNYSVWTPRSFFKDVNGGLHIAFLSNYKLNYYYSHDGGETWVGEEIVTGLEGGIKFAVICADENGSPYIAITVNSYYNYGNPTNISFGQEFAFDTYFLLKNEGFWSIETVHIHTGNYGNRVSELYREPDGRFVLLGSRAGWYDYGGEIWEFTRNIDGAWSALNVIYDYGDTPVDHSLIYVYSVNNQNEEKDLIYCRHYNAEGVPEVATIHFDGTTWGSPMTLTNPLYNYVSWDMTQDRTGNSWIASFINDPEPMVFLSENFQSAMQIPIDFSLLGDISAVRINYTNDQLLNLIIYPMESDSVLVILSENMGQTWGDPIYADRSIMGGNFAKTDQYGDILPDLEFIKIIRVSSEEPFGPDSLFYGNVEKINSTLGIDQNEAVNSTLNFYPNPVMDELTVTYDLSIPAELNLMIYNLQGKEVFKKNYSGNQGETIIKLDIGFLDAGTYIIEVFENGYPTNQSAGKKLIKLPIK